MDCVLVLPDNSLTNVLFSLVEIHILLGDKFLGRRGIAIEPVTAWELKDMLPREERSLTRHERVYKGPI